MMAIYQGVFIFSVGIGPLPGGFLAERHGLAAPFVAYAAAGIVAGWSPGFAVPETRGVGATGVGSQGIGRVSMMAQLRLLLAHVGFRLVCAVAFMNAIARTGALFSIIPLLGKLRLDLTATEIGLGLALGSLSGLLVTYPAGSLADRYGRKTVIVPATLIAATSMALFSFAPSYAWFLAACMTWGTAIAVGGAAPAAYAADSAPPGMNAAAMSSFRMLGDLGYVLGPLVLGVVADAVHPEGALLTAASGLLVVGILFGLRAPESHAPVSASSR